MTERSPRRGTAPTGTPAPAETTRPRGAASPVAKAPKASTKPAEKQASKPASGTAPARARKATTSGTTTKAAKAGAARSVKAVKAAKTATSGTATKAAKAGTTKAAKKAVTSGAATKVTKAGTAAKVAKAPRARQATPKGGSGRRDAIPQGVMQQIDTTPDDAAGAILLAAMELMGSKGPAKVSLRDIAAKAGVNYGLIHRHFGTKDSLLLGIFQAFTDYGASIIRSSETIHEAVEGTFNADSGRYADLLASAVLDGMDPRRLYVDSSGMADFAAHIAAEWAEPSEEFERRPAFDPRVVGSFVMLMVVVWDFYAPYMQVVNGYEDRDLSEVRTEVLDLMKFLVSASRPDTSS